MSKLTATPMPPVIKELAILSTVQVFCSGKIKVKINKLIPARIKIKLSIKFKFFIMQLKDNWLEKDELENKIYCFELDENAPVYLHTINNPYFFSNFILKLKSNPILEINY